MIKDDSSYFETYSNDNSKIPENLINTLNRNNDDIQEILNKTKRNKKTGMDAIILNSDRSLFSENKMINSEIKDIEIFDY